MPVSKARLWTGRVLSGLLALFLLVDGGAKIAGIQPVLDASAKYGYDAPKLFWIGLALVVSTILYLIPGTQVLGAILITGYLGGAINTHVVANEPYVFALAFGVLAWVGLWLRDPRIREFAQLRVRL